MTSLIFDPYLVLWARGHVNILGIPQDQQDQQIRNLW